MPCTRHIQVKWGAFCGQQQNMRVTFSSRNFEEIDQTCEVKFHVAGIRTNVVKFQGKNAYRYELIKSMMVTSCWRNVRRSGLRPSEWWIPRKYCASHPYLRRPMRPSRDIRRGPPRGWGIWWRRSWPRLFSPETNFGRIPGRMPLEKEGRNRWEES